MEIKKACQICQSEMAVASCKMCGRLVCEKHYDKWKGICSECFTS